MRRVAAALACVVVCLVGVGPVRAGQAPAPPTTAANGARSRLALVSQSPFVGPGTEFSLRLRIEKAGLASTAEVAATVFRAVETRSEFEETLSDRISRSPLVGPLLFPVSSLGTDSAGETTLRIPTTDLGSADGVYPVRVDLRDRSGTLERFTTHVVYLAGNHSGPRLGLGLVIPIRGQLALPADAPRELTGLDDLAAGIQALETARTLPFVLEPSPETVEALAETADDKAVRAIEALRRLAADRPVVAGPYVPVSPAALMTAGLADEIGSQLGRGNAVLSEILRVKPDFTTWVETDPLDPESIDELIRRGVDRIVATESVLDPVPDLYVTLSRPFVLAGREEDAPAVAGDLGLAAHFNNNPNQVLQAHHLLADLAVLWLDAPAADHRAVVAVTPPEWRPTRAFLDALATGLASNPTTEALPLDGVFTTVLPAVSGRGVALVRHPAPPPPGGLGELAADVRQARKRLTSLGSILDEPSPTTLVLEERLLIAESSELRGNRAREAYVHAVETGIDDNLAAIQMPEGRSITLTDRRGQIPVTFQNRTGSIAKVVVTVQSDKLEFPDGASRPLELVRRNTTERFSVLARTSGAFPLRITLQSPDGNLVIGRARLTVRSTAASRVSVFVSAGATVFLAGWWGRHAIRGRRARRLVPA